MIRKFAFNFNIPQYKLKIMRHTFAGTKHPSRKSDACHPEKKQQPTSNIASWRHIQCYSCQISLCQASFPSVSVHTYKITGATGMKPAAGSPQPVWVQTASNAPHDARRARRKAFRYLAGSRTIPLPRHGACALRRARMAVATGSGNSPLPCPHGSGDRRQAALLDRAAPPGSGEDRA